jgi:hypothetical protein
MAVAPDVSASTSSGATTTLTTPTFTIAALANRAGTLTWHSNASTDTPTGDIGGTAATAITGTDSGVVGANRRSMMMGVVAPPSGTLKTGTVTWTNSVAAAIGVVVANGVNQGGVNAGTFTNGTFTSATGSNPSLAITSSAGDMTQDGVIGIDPNSISCVLSAPTQTQQWLINNIASNFMASGGSTAAGSVSNTHGWTLATNGTKNWTSSGVNFAQAATIALQQGGMLFPRLAQPTSVGLHLG